VPGTSRPISLTALYSRPSVGISLKNWRVDVEALYQYSPLYVNINVYYAPVPNRRGIKAMLLSDVCVSRTSGITREQTGLGRPKLANR